MSGDNLSEVIERYGGCNYHLNLEIIVFFVNHGLRGPSQLVSENSMPTTLMRNRVGGEGETSLDHG